MDCLRRVKSRIPSPLEWWVALIRIQWIEFLTISCLFCHICAVESEDNLLYRNNRRQVLMGVGGEWDGKIPCCCCCCSRKNKGIAFHWEIFLNLTKENEIFHFSLPSVLRVIQEMKKRSRNEWIPDWNFRHFSQDTRALCVPSKLFHRRHHCVPPSSSDEDWVAERRDKELLNCRLALNSK